MADRPDETTKEVYRKAISIIGEKNVKKLFAELGGAEKLSVYSMHRIVIENEIQENVKSGNVDPEDLSERTGVPIWTVKRIITSQYNIKKPKTGTD